MNFEVISGDGELLEDYCALLLSHSDVTKKLDEYGLSYLKCGEGKYLESSCKCSCHEQLVAIFGHPDCGDAKNAHPLRLSFGTEKRPNSFPKDALDNYVLYDNDTLSGNSESPVIGRGDRTTQQGYCVKGIHIAGSYVKDINKAQKINKIKEWINIGCTFKDATF